MFLCYCTVQHLSAAGKGCSICQAMQCHAEQPSVTAMLLLRYCWLLTADTGTTIADVIWYLTYIPETCTLAASASRHVALVCS